MIYLDNASTSFPKPQEVILSIQEYLTDFGVSPGRGAHSLAEQASEMVKKTRKMLTQMIGGSRENNLIFTQNATHSLNLVIKGFLTPKDHVLICSYSHNSVIRPIDALQRRGVITYDVYDVDVDGSIDLKKFCELIKPNTRLVIGNHASNVIGVIADSLEIAKICRGRGIHFMLDCTQSLGYVPIHMNDMPIDFLAGTGHKSLLGPTGIGFLYVKDSKTVETLMEGGSGGNLSSSPFHPSQMPYKFEAGTLNATGIAGLKGSLDYIEKVSFRAIANKSLSIMEYAWEQLNLIEEVILHGTSVLQKKVPIISFKIIDTLSSEIAHLYSREGICLRAGLHCAPLIHKKLGTLPTGTLRISMGHFNQYKDIDNLIQVTKKILSEAQYAKTCA